MSAVTTSIPSPNHAVGHDSRTPEAQRATIALSCDHILPADRYAGRDMQRSARAWAMDGVQCFLRIEHLGGGVFLTTTGDFDADGFGSIRSGMVTGTSACRAWVESALRSRACLVLVDYPDLGVLPRPLVESAQVRMIRDVRRYERDVLGMERVVDARWVRSLVDRAVIAGEPAARLELAAQARADLFALITMHGELGSLI